MLPYPQPHTVRHHARGRSTGGNTPAGAANATLLSPPRAPAVPPASSTRRGLLAHTPPPHMQSTNLSFNNAAAAPLFAAALRSPEAVAAVAQMHMQQSPPVPRPPSAPSTGSSARHAHSYSWTPHSAASPLRRGSPSPPPPLQPSPGVLHSPSPRHAHTRYSSPHAPSPPSHAPPALPHWQQTQQQQQLDTPTRAQLLAQWNAEKESQRAFLHNSYTPAASPRHSAVSPSPFLSPSAASPHVRARTSPLQLQLTSPEHADSNSSSAASLLEAHRWTDPASTSAAAAAAAASAAVPAQSPGRASPAFPAPLSARRSPVNQRTSPQHQLQQSPQHYQQPQLQQSPRMGSPHSNSSNQPYRSGSELFFIKSASPAQANRDDDARNGADDRGEDQGSDATASPREDEDATHPAVSQSRLLRQQQYSTANQLSDFDLLLPSLPSVRSPVAPYATSAAAGTIESPHDPLPLEPRLQISYSPTTGEKQTSLAEDHFWCAWTRTHQLDANAMPLGEQMRILGEFCSGARAVALVRPSEQAPAALLLSGGSTQSALLSIPSSQLAPLLLLAPLPLLLCILDLFCTTRRSFLSFSQLAQSLGSTVASMLLRWKKQLQREGILVPLGSDAAWQKFQRKHVRPFVSGIVEEARRDEARRRREEELELARAAAKPYRFGTNSQQSSAFPSVRPSPQASPKDVAEMRVLLQHTATAGGGWAEAPTPVQATHSPEQTSSSHLQPSPPSSSATFSSFASPSSKRSSMTGAVAPALSTEASPFTTAAAEQQVPSLAAIVESKEPPPTQLAVVTSLAAAPEEIITSPPRLSPAASDSADSRAVREQILEDEIRRLRAQLASVAAAALVNAAPSVVSRPHPVPPKPTALPAVIISSVRSPDASPALSLSPRASDSLHASGFPQQQSQPQPHAHRSRRSSHARGKSSLDDLAEVGEGADADELAAAKDAPAAKTVQPQSKAQPVQQQVPQAAAATAPSEATVAPSSAVSPAIASTEPVSAVVPVVEPAVMEPDAAASPKPAEDSSAPSRSTPPVAAVFVDTAAASQPSPTVTAVSPGSSRAAVPKVPHVRVDAPQREESPASSRRSSDNIPPVAAPAAGTQSAAPASQTANMGSPEPTPATIAALRDSMSSSLPRHRTSPSIVPEEAQGCLSADDASQSSSDHTPKSGTRDALKLEGPAAPVPATAAVTVAPAAAATSVEPASTAPSSSAAARPPSTLLYSHSRAPSDSGFVQQLLTELAASDKPASGIATGSPDPQLYRPLKGLTPPTNPRSESQRSERSTGATPAGATAAASGDSASDLSPLTLPGPSIGLNAKVGALAVDAGTKDSSPASTSSLQGSASLKSLHGVSPAHKARILGARGQSHSPRHSASAQNTSSTGPPSGHGSPGSILLSPALAARRPIPAGIVTPGSPAARNSPVQGSVCSTPTKGKHAPLVVPALPPPPKVASGSSVPSSPVGTDAGNGTGRAHVWQGPSRAATPLPQALPLSSLLAAGQLQSVDQAELESVLLDYPQPEAASIVSTRVRGASSAQAPDSNHGSGFQTDSPLFGPAKVRPSSRAASRSGFRPHDVSSLASLSRKVGASGPLFPDVASSPTASTQDLTAAASPGRSSSDDAVRAPVSHLTVTTGAEDSSSPAPVVEVANSGDMIESLNTADALADAPAFVATAPPSPSTAAPVVSMDQIAQFLLSVSPSLFVSRATRAALTTTDVEYLVQVGHSELSTLQHLQSLQRLGKQFDSFHDLLLAVHELQTFRVARRNYVVASLSYPRCTLFSEAATPVHVEASEIDWVVDACNGEVEWIDYYVCMLDMHGWRVNSFSKLAGLMKRTYEQVGEQQKLVGKFLTFDESAEEGSPTNGGSGSSAPASGQSTPTSATRDSGGGSLRRGHHSRGFSTLSRLPYPVPLRLLRDSNNLPRTMDSGEVSELVRKLGPLQHVSSLWAFLRQEQLRNTAAHTAAHGPTGDKSAGPPTLASSSSSASLAASGVPALETALPPLAVLQALALERASFRSHSSLFRGVWSAGDYPPVPPFIHALVGLDDEQTAAGAAAGAGVSEDFAEADLEQAACKRAKERLREMQARRHRQDAAIANAEAATSRRKASVALAPTAAAAAFIPTLPDSHVNEAAASVTVAGATHSGQV